MIRYRLYTGPHVDQGYHVAKLHAAGYVNVMAVFDAVHFDSMADQFTVYRCVRIIFGHTFTLADLTVLRRLPEEVTP